MGKQRLCIRMLGWGPGTVSGSDEAGVGGAGRGHLGSYPKKLERNVGFLGRSREWQGTPRRRGASTKVKGERSLKQWPNLWSPQHHPMMEEGSLQCSLARALAASQDDSSSGKVFALPWPPPPSPHLQGRGGGMEKEPPTPPSTFPTAGKKQERRSKPKSNRQFP